MSGEGILSLGIRLSHSLYVCVSVCQVMTARGISLGSEGNALYPVLSSLYKLLVVKDSCTRTCIFLHPNTCRRNLCEFLVQFSWQFLVQFCVTA